MKLWISNPTSRDNLWEFTNTTGRRASIRFRRYGNDDQGCYIPDHSPEDGEPILRSDLADILSEDQLERADARARAVLGVETTPDYELFRIGSTVGDGHNIKCRTFYFGSVSIADSRMMS